MRTPVAALLVLRRRVSAAEDASSRIRPHMLANATTVSGGLDWLGAPNAAMRGAIVALLNFIPRFGPCDGVLLPGRRFPLNPGVLFVSSIFWTWLWGAPGAWLSMPILASIKVVCDSVPNLATASEQLAS